MPSQLFKITRASEADPVNSNRLRSLLWNDRKDSEWEVTEIIPTLDRSAVAKHSLPGNEAI